MKSYYLFGSLQIKNNSNMYNRYGKQKVVNSLSKQGRILSITNQKGKNDNSFIYSIKFIDVSERMIIALFTLSKITNFVYKVHLRIRVRIRARIRIRIRKNERKNSYPNFINSCTNFEGRK